MLSYQQRGLDMEGQGVWRPELGPPPGHHSRAGPQGGSEMAEITPKSLDSPPSPLLLKGTYPHINDAFLKSPLFNFSVYTYMGLVYNSETNEFFSTTQLHNWETAASWNLSKRYDTYRGVMHMPVWFTTLLCFLGATQYSNQNDPECLACVG